MISTKEHPSPFDGMEKAAPDEPVFTLIARDPDAPDTVRHWAYIRRKRISSDIIDLGSAEVPEDLLNDLRRCLEAEDIAEEMDAWSKGGHAEELVARAVPYNGLQTISDRDVAIAQLKEKISSAMKEADYHVAAAIEAFGLLPTSELDELCLQEVQKIHQRVHQLALSLVPKRES